MKSSCLAAKVGAAIGIRHPPIDQSKEFFEFLLDRCNKLLPQAFTWVAMGDMRNRAADVERLTRWVRDHGPAVKGYISSFVRDPASVDDLFQEVFCRAWEARGRYFESGKDRSYLLTIADRLCRDRGRRPAKEIQIGEDAWRKVEPLDRGPDAPAYVDVEAQAQLRRALSGLSESQRRTLLLRYWGDCDFSQIAGILEVPLGTALSHCRRGLLALQRILAGVIEK